MISDGVAAHSSSSIHKLYCDGVSDLVGILEVSLSKVHGSHNPGNVMSCRDMDILMCDGIVDIGLVHESGDEDRCLVLLSGGLPGSGGVGLVSARPPGHDDCLELILKVSHMKSC